MAEHHWYVQLDGLVTIDTHKMELWHGVLTVINPFRPYMQMLQWHVIGLTVKFDLLGLIRATIHLGINLAISCKCLDGEKPRKKTKI